MKRVRKENKKILVRSVPFLLLRRTMTSRVVIACGFVTRIHGEGEYKQSVLNTMGGVGFGMVKKE